MIPRDDSADYIYPQITQITQILVDHEGKE